MLHFSRNRFNFKRFRQFFVLALLAAIVIIGVAAHLSGTLEVSSLAWQSLAIAALVGAGAGLTDQEGRNAQAADPASARPAHGTAGSNASRAPDPEALAMDSLEEQGITIKLLELTALGDRYGNVFSVAMIGVDHLDDFIDQYDRTVTEQLLSKVADALAETVRMPDRVGEIQGGTYLVVLPETGLRGAIQIAERLRDAVSGLDIEVSNRIHAHTTASVGVTSFRRGDDLHSLVQRAEKALREAQNQGPNRVLPDMAA